VGAPEGAVDSAEGEERGGEGRIALDYFENCQIEKHDFVGMTFDFRL
jgi:hypothetical protein